MPTLDLAALAPFTAWDLRAESSSFALAGDHLCTG
jgi:hypothetical protein